MAWHCRDWLKTSLGSSSTVIHSWSPGLLHPPTMLHSHIYVPFQETSISEKNSPGRTDWTRTIRSPLTVKPKPCWSFWIMTQRWTRPGRGQRERKDWPSNLWRLVHTSQGQLKKDPQHFFLKRLSHTNPIPQTHPVQTQDRLPSHWQTVGIPYETRPFSVLKNCLSLIYGSPFWFVWVWLVKEGARPSLTTLLKTMLQQKNILWVDWKLYVMLLPMTPAGRTLIVANCFLQSWMPHIK